ncbi:MAG: hypothetical protein JSS94_08770 [Bacteroidetes bacterium]|nr:hypothetical protein [Bacteroidota bacterium]
MKKIHYIQVLSFLLLIFMIASCDSHRDRDERKIIAINDLKLDSVKINSDTMMVNSVQSIRTYFTLHSNCEGFYTYQYAKDGMERKVKTLSYKTDGVCNSETKAYYTQFEFMPESTGTYQFKFWQGKDNAGNDIWLNKQIVVN